MKSKGKDVEIKIGKKKSWQLIPSFLVYFAILLSLLIFLMLDISLLCVITFIAEETLKNLSMRHVKGIQLL